MKRWEEAVEDFRRNMEELARTGNCEGMFCCEECPVFIKLGYDCPDSKQRRMEIMNEDV